MEFYQIFSHTKQASPCGAGVRIRTISQGLLHGGQRLSPGDGVPVLDGWMQRGGKDKVWLDRGHDRCSRCSTKIAGQLMI